MHFGNKNISKMTDTSNQVVPNNASGGVGANRLNNIQKIQLRKQQVRDWPHSKKLEKLAVYSSCKVYFKCSFMIIRNFLAYFIFSLMKIANAMVGKIQLHLKIIQ